MTDKIQIDVKHLKVFGEPDEGTMSQIKTCLDSAHDGARGVLCADAHKGYAQPIGGVIGYRDAISISGVGFDIACGNMAINTGEQMMDIFPNFRDDIEEVMDKIAREISFGIGRTNHFRDCSDHPLFDDPAWEIPAIKPFKEVAKAQLGTVGSGNHYVDIFVDEKGLVWVGVHFGSRGFGHKTATAFLKLAGGQDGMDVAPCVVSLDTELGREYLAAMQLAGRYAYAGREYVARHVAVEILNCDDIGRHEEIHNHHNFAWKENHYGEDLWVVRKGATPAFPGQRGFVGGSMGDISVILEGVESDESKESLYSTIHGAGRVMSRTEAKGKYDRKTGKQKSVGKISREAMMEWVNGQDVVLRGGDLDEAPQAYRRLPDVLDAHEGTIKIIEQLKPLGVAMAGRGANDPYKD